MKKNKVLRTIYPDEDMDDVEVHGVTIFNDETIEICVNVEKIWEDIEEDRRIKHKEDNFIKQFACAYTHELLHTEISTLIFDLYAYGEEKLIRAMLGEKWTEYFKDYYTVK